MIGILERGKLGMYRLLQADETVGRKECTSCIYKTVAFVWVKLNRKSDSLFWGMGHWTRANAEFCLLATRGNPKRQSARVHQIILSHIQEHSRKPAETRDRIVQLMGDLPRIELFARESVPGWDVWGNEAPGSISLEPYQNLSKERK